MKISAWRRVTAIAFLGSVWAVGCVVTSDDDDPEEMDGAVGTGGKGGSAGATTGGKGGGSGTGGTSGTAGTGGTGGSGGSTQMVVCDKADAGKRTPGASCAPEADGGADLACQQCVQQNCCAEWKACVATGPLDPCGFGGPKGEGEIICFQSCVFDAQAEGGVASTEVINRCAGGCATQGCGTISDATNDMVACLRTPCFDTCLQP